MTSTTLGTTTRLLGLGLALSVGAGGVLVAVGAGSAEAGSATSQYGTIGVADGTLPPANQCATYTVDYALTPPKGDWALETFVVDPRGNTVASAAILSDYSPGGAASSIPFQLCSNNTAPGTFTVYAKITTDDGTGKVTNYPALTPATFVLSSYPTPAKVKKKTCKNKTYRKRHPRTCGRRR